MCVGVGEAADRHGQQGNKQGCPRGKRGLVFVRVPVVVYGGNGLLGLDLF